MRVRGSRQIEQSSPNYYAAPPAVLVNLVWLPELL